MYPNVSTIVHIRPFRAARRPLVCLIYRGKSFQASGGGVSPFRLYHRELRSCKFASGLYLNTGNFIQAGQLRSFEGFVSFLFSAYCSLAL